MWDWLSGRMEKRVGLLFICLCNDEGGLTPEPRRGYGFDITEGGGEVIRGTSYWEHMGGNPLCTAGSIAATQKHKAHWKQTSGLWRHGLSVQWGDSKEMCQQEKSEKSFI